MDQPLTSQQLLHNSYHLSIRSSLLAIQSILSRQETILQSNHYTVVDIKSAISFQNATLQRITKTLAETFPKISSYKPPLPQPRSTPSVTVPAGSPPKMAPTATTSAGTISTATPTSTTATPPIADPPLTPSCCLASPTQPHVAATRSAPLFSPSAQTKTSTIIDAQQLPVCYGQKPVALASFKTPHSPLEISINQLGKISNDSLHGSSLYDGIKMQLDCQIFSPEIEQYGHKLFDTMLLGIWCAKLALEHNLRKEQQWTNAHNLFVEMYKLKYERKILIFDPGGDIFSATCFFAIWSNHAEYNINGHRNKMFNKFDKCISDLEDKVDLEGVGNDTHTTTHRCKEEALLTRPKRLIQLLKGC